MLDKLLPCPFCGGAAEMQPWHGGGPEKQMIDCSSYECEVRPGVTGETAAEAIENWNRRAPQALARRDGGEGEAVAWRAVHSEGHSFLSATRPRDAGLEGRGWTVTPLYAHPAPASAPGDGVRDWRKWLCPGCGVGFGVQHTDDCQVMAENLASLRQPDPAAPFFIKPGEDPDEYRALGRKRADTTPAEDARMARGEGEHTVGAAWSCKIGTREGVGVPRGADAPMRSAIQKAFRDVTGVDAEFCFSGWSAKLTEPEMAVVENRPAAAPADPRPDPRDEALREARNLRAAQTAYMADRGNGELGKAVGLAAGVLDQALAKIDAVMGEAG